MTGGWPRGGVVKEVRSPRTNLQFKAQPRQLENTGHLCMCAPNPDSGEEEKGWQRNHAYWGFALSDVCVGSLVLF